MTYLHIFLVLAAILLTLWCGYTLGKRNTLREAESGTDHPFLIPFLKEFEKNTLIQIQIMRTWEKGILLVTATVFKNKDSSRPCSAKLFLQDKDVLPYYENGYYLTTGDVNNPLVRNIK